jgi:hypothetical protein
VRLPGPFPGQKMRAVLNASQPRHHEPSESELSPSARTPFKTTAPHDGDDGAGEVSAAFSSSPQRGRARSHLRRLPLYGTLSTCCSLELDHRKGTSPSSMETMSPGASTTSATVEVEREFDVAESTVAPSFDGLASISRVKRSPVQTLDAVFRGALDARCGVVRRR